jgi:hypothetical protein
MPTERETESKKQLSDIITARVVNLIVVYFDPYYDSVIVLDKIATTIADDQKRDKIRACLDSDSREEDQLWCIFREAGLVDMWQKYKNVIGSRAWIRSANR